MLYATDGIDSDNDFNKAMVGVASVWYALYLTLLLLHLKNFQVRRQPVRPLAFLNRLPF